MTDDSTATVECAICGGDHAATAHHDWREAAHEAVRQLLGAMTHRRDTGAERLWWAHARVLWAQESRR